MRFLALIALLAALLVEGVAANSSRSYGAKDDLNQKTGSLLYKATYLNDPTKRTRAVLAGNFSAYNGVTSDLGGGIRITTFFNVEVLDKKNQKMPWINLYTAWPTVFPPSVIPASFGLGTQSIINEQYQLTALDQTSKILLGSLVIAGTYAGESGAITGAGAHMYAVLGANGVYKHARSVKITYGDNGERDVEIYKTAF